MNNVMGTGLTNLKIWGKKNFSFGDAQKIADALGYDFFYELRKRDGAD